MDKLIEKQLEAGLEITKSGEAGIISGIFSTSQRDREGDIIEQDWDTSEFEQNPVLLWNHDPHFPIGKVNTLKLAKTKSGFEADVSATGFAQEVRTLMDEGIVRYASHRFRSAEAIPIDDKGREARDGSAAGYRFRKNVLVEISVVAIPANLGAAISARAAEFPMVCKALAMDKHRALTVDREPDECDNDTDGEQEATARKTADDISAVSVAAVRLLGGKLEILRSHLGGAK